MHSTLACRFYSVPFPSQECAEVLPVLYFNSPSASLRCFQQFQIQTEFCKGGAARSRGAALFLLHTPWAIHLAFVLQKSKDG